VPYIKYSNSTEARTEIVIKTLLTSKCFMTYGFNESNTGQKRPKYRK